MPRHRVDLATRFWRKVDTSGACWIWTGYRLPNGYGRIGVENSDIWRIEYAHRVAWELTHGPIPAGLVVCHHCDNPPCVNPAHLFIGTDADNMHDRDAKGRQARGQKASYPRALSDADALSIKRRLAAGEKAVQLAREYGVTQSTISHIKTGHSRAWQQI
jgi:hypothetical protein